MFAGRERLARIDCHLDRGDELMQSVRDELRLTREMHERNYALMLREFDLNRAEFELNRREHRETRAAVQNLRDVCRALVVQVEQNTQTLRDLRGEIRAQTEGLIHVLDELRGRGPRSAPAAS